MKKFLISVCCLSLLSVTKMKADEGMWLPILLDQLNMTDMKARGFQLSAEDIYSINKSSMKDAVCQFGGGCTGEIISGKGLLLTNHHCGYSAIHAVSTDQHNYLRDGFWAMKPEEEIPAVGITAVFIVRMQDVTGLILIGLNDTMTEARRTSVIDKNMRDLEKVNTKDGYDALVRPFYYGNAYYMFITETFTDVRLVGAPPEEIGNFGQDSDNWMWPRQTGDFSLFRVYAGKDNRPAKYSKDNVPYAPKHFFKINAGGIGENDFTMVYGFPGRTTEYLSSWAVDLIANVSDPIKVDLRTERITIMEEEMAKNDSIRLRYSAKRNSVANYWKKWQGEMNGLKNNDAVGKKQSRETEFQKRVDADPAKKAKYGTLLGQLQTAHTDVKPWQQSVDYMSEGCLTIEAFRFANSFRKLIDLSQKENPDTTEIRKQRDALIGGSGRFFNEYNLTIDKRIAAALFSISAANMPLAQQPALFATVNAKYKGDFAKYIDQLFGKSIFTNKAKLMAILKSYKAADWKKLSKDPLYMVTADLFDHYNKKILPEFGKRNNEINRLNRLYMAAQMEVFPETRFYPDANSTLRVAYGNVKSYTPRDGVNYNWFCTLDGVMQKEDSTIFDYQVPPRLRMLWEKKDFGKYADKKDGKLHTSFIATNHTTGGNSGSPVIDANGNLIGTNFDRCWEGTMSDINYDPAVCRNITLDIRYTLFVIDKFGGAGYLLDEMVILW
jgi:Peptidase S46